MSNNSKKTKAKPLLSTTKSKEQSAGMGKPRLESILNSANSITPAKGTVGESHQ